MSHKSTPVDLGVNTLKAFGAHVVQDPHEVEELAMDVANDCIRCAFMRL